MVVEIRDLMASIEELDEMKVELEEQLREIAKEREGLIVEVTRLSMKPRGEIVIGS